MTDLNTLSKTHIVDLFCSDINLRLDIIENMQKYGGSFVKALADCFLRADPINRVKLAESFTDYIIKYQPKDFPKNDTV